ncbi:response regulator [Candidatus Chlorohelix sp.]|uniref:response regulator n=1 Tax=Candidatus Chlorohelix sp. TaxID=3139201 RepID=UPI00303E2E5A
MAMIENLPKRILIVDDDTDILTLLRFQLRCTGWSISTATDGAEALDLFLSAPFDLVLTDAMMPGMSGYDLARFVRTSEKGCSTPIIMLSAILDTPDQLELAKDSGVDVYITKPHDRKQLQAQINILLESPPQRYVSRI